ncbi:MAG: ATP-binding protein [Bdellovibrionales bacterium]
MTTMKTDFVGRVRRLPEPRTTAEALQPLFEAVMNSIHSTQDKFDKQVAALGRIEVTIKKGKNKSPLKIIVQDNGKGLDAENYNAFLTTDTEHKKITRGGKGVGRLLWLSCFEEIEITSDFLDNGHKQRRSFRFVLKDEEQIENEALEDVNPIDNETGLNAVFIGLRKAYAEKFPQRATYLFQHLLSHFLPVMVGNMCPQISISYGEDSRTFPQDIQDYIKHKEKTYVLHEGNKLTLEMLECDKVVSSNLQGSNFVHFIAHDRTVHSQPIDGKLGLKAFSCENEERVFHALLSGEFLNTHVNQERTKFTFEDDVIEKIINDSCMAKIATFLDEPLKKVKKDQMQEISKIVGHYPSIEFDTLEELSKIVPAGETRDDQLYGTLSIHRYRRDKKQRDKINAVVEKLRREPFKYETFDGALKEASTAVIDTERRSLAEYVVRRKVLIDFLRELLKAAQKTSSDSDYELESTLHNFICPIRIKSSRVEAASHDLWIIDERLTFSRTFSSDMPFQEILEVSQNGDRADLLVFDNAYGLRHGNSDPYVLVVEFKRPGRQTYKDDENPQFQIEKYIREMQTNNAVDIDGRPIRLSPNTRFHCFLVADRRGKLADWTSSWPATPDGRGRIYALQGDYKGFIEVIEWDQLIDDAHERNQAFFDKAGIN